MACMVVLRCRVVGKVWSVFAMVPSVVAIMQSGLHSVECGSCGGECACYSVDWVVMGSNVVAVIFSVVCDCYSVECGLL